MNSLEDGFREAVNGRDDLRWEESAEFFKTLALCRIADRLNEMSAIAQWLEINARSKT